MKKTAIVPHGTRCFCCPTAEKKNREWKYSLGFLAILNVLSSFMLLNLAIEFFILFDKRRGNGKEFPVSLHYPYGPVQNNGSDGFGHFPLASYRLSK